MEAIAILLAVISLLILFSTYAIYRTMEEIRRDLHEHLNSIFPNVVTQKHSSQLQTKLTQPKAIIKKPMTRGQARQSQESKNTPEIAKLSPEQMTEQFEKTGNPLDDLLKTS